MSEGIVKTWYGSARWKHRRAQQLALEPCCRMCAKDGLVRLASVADHVEPHRGDAEKFWNGALQSLCVGHHSGDKQALEKTGRVRLRVGLDGWPV